jgi:hypothetical protein
MFFLFRTFVLDLKLEVMDDCNELVEPWFKSSIDERVDLPVGFQEWVDDITQYKYNIIFPDKTMTDARLFIDLQGVFNDGSYTNYLINRYNEATEV